MTQPHEMTYQEAFTRLAELAPEQLKQDLTAWEQYGNPDQRNAAKNWRAGKRPTTGGGDSTSKQVVDTWNRQLREWRAKTGTRPDLVATVFREASADSLPGRARSRLRAYHLECIEADLAHEWDPEGLRSALEEVLFHLYDEICELRFRLEVADKRIALLQTIDADANLLGYRGRYCFRVNLDTASTTQAVQVRDELDEIEQAIRSQQQERLDRDLRALSRHQPRTKSRSRR